MGWKNLKERYNIGHIVQVTKAGICIGSGYIHDLLVVEHDGRVVKRYERPEVNEDLARYQAEFDADPEALRLAVTTPDTFAVSLPVFTYDGGTIVEEACEEYGWPNVTHAGHVMYENGYSKDKATVVKWAKKNAAATVSMIRDRVKCLEDQLGWERLRLVAAECNAGKLATDYPDPTAVVPPPVDIVTDAPKPLHCPFCGVELADQDGKVLGDGTREWMCNVCGETGRVEEPV